MHYMQWMKVDAPAAIELRPSGIAQMNTDQLSFTTDDIEIKSTGFYGDNELVQLVADHQNVKNAQILLVPGASSGIFIAMAAACTNAGRSILIEEHAYEPIIRAAETLGLKITRLPRKQEGDFEIRMETLEERLREGVDALFITNHHNPSGFLLNPDRMQEIQTRCAEHKTQLIVDEVYLRGAAITKQGQAWSAAECGPNVITINSLTKLHGFSGLRCGWLTGHPILIDAARRIMDVLSVNNAGPAMSLAKVVLKHAETWEEQYAERQRQSRQVLDTWLQQEERVTTYPDHGHLYACLKFLPTVTTDGRSTPFNADEFTRQLREDFDTAVVPGSFFDLPDHVRIGLGANQQMLEQGLTNISNCLDQFP